MEYIKIDVPDMNDSVSRVVLGGQNYNIRFTYNHTCDCWSFGLYDDLQKPIRVGIKIVPNFPLNIFCTSEDMPVGVFGCFSELEKIGRRDFAEGKAKFVFIPR